MRRSQRGSSLFETTLALALAGVILLISVYFVQGSFKGTRHNNDKVFATQKAIAMLEELKGIVESRTPGAINLLDGYDDGAVLNPILTTQREITDPAAPASDNHPQDDGWRFLRRVTVSKIPSMQAHAVRVVNVRVFRVLEDGRHLSLAEVSGVIRTIADNYPPTQAYDVYCIAAYQVPGWWVYMNNLVPFVQSAIQDLQARNPGLEFRVHWIRNLAYGRDAQYRPFINDTVPSTTAIDWAYFYPGKLPASDDTYWDETTKKPLSQAPTPYYYVPSQFRGRVNIDGTKTNDYNATTNPYPYAIADQYNHAMRWADEVALHELRAGAGLETELTYRGLLDDMYLNPDKYRNAILINVHGELMPFPPVRNYSDPAKDPVGASGVRVVTHPERLHFDSGQKIRLRVYGYLTDPSASTKYADAVSVLVRNADVRTTAAVKALKGGPAYGETYAWITPLQTPPASGKEPYYTVDYRAGVGTLFTLHNVRLKAGESGSGAGLDDTKRLYGMEYIPSPIEAGSSAFARDLTKTGNLPKNTARWTIEFTAPVENLMYAFETRLGAVDLADTASWPGHPNLSKTYAWYGSDEWAWGDPALRKPPHVPVSEMFQYQGDPRYSPYADQVSVAYNAVTNPIGGGFNRYFAGASVTDYPALVVTPEGWVSGDPAQYGSSKLDVDVNRIMQALRTTLVRSNAIWTTLTGWSYYYLGLGNEVGYDSANGFRYSVPVSGRPYGLSGSFYEDTITHDKNQSSGKYGGVKLPVNGSWYARPWLGELYPDSSYANWAADGNLAVASGFKLVRRPDITGTPLGATALGRRMQQAGSTAFFNIGSTTSTFTHAGRDGYSGNLLGGTSGQGAELGQAFNFVLPDKIKISRPFSLSSAPATRPPDFLGTASSSPKYYGGTLSAEAIARYYSSDEGGTFAGSQLVQVTGTEAATDAAFVVVNGIDRTVNTGSAFIGRWSFLTLIHGYLAGAQADTNKIPQLPRVKIVEPNEATDLQNVGSVEVEWTTAWRRWDDQAYTTKLGSYSDTSTVLRCAPLVSADQGKTWKYPKTGAAAIPGTRPPDGTYLSGTIATDWTYSLPVPSSEYPAGSYLIMIECYREGGSQMHYAYHRRKIFLKR